MSAVPPQIEQKFLRELSGAMGCVLLVDVRDLGCFKYRFHFTRGDLLLVALHENLGELAAGSAVHRWGPDEFVVVLPGTLPPETLFALIARVRRCAADAFARVLAGAEQEDAPWWIDKRVNGYRDIFPVQAVSVGVAIGALTPELVEQAIADYGEQRRLVPGTGSVASHGGARER